MNRTAAGVVVILGIGVIAALAIALWPDAEDASPTPTPIRAHATGAPSDATPLVAATAATDAAATFVPPSPSPVESPSAGLAIADPLSWPRASRRDFGCMLEKQAGYHDRLWSCSSPEEVPLGDPCDDRENYYRGPQLEDDVIAKISPLLTHVSLQWEHGQLQGATFDFKPGVSDEQIRAAFSISGTGRTGRDNVMSADVQDCAADYKCLVLQGFDHEGAGDVDCGDGRQPD